MQSTRSDEIILPTNRELWLQVASTILWPSLSASVVLVACVTPILSMSSHQVMLSFEFIAIAAPILMAGIVYWHSGPTRPLRVYLDRRRDGEDVDADELGAALRAATAFPQRQFIPAIACWWIGGVFSAYIVATNSDAFGFDSAVVLSCSAAMAGFIASALQYVGLKNKFVKSIFSDNISIH